MFTALIAFFVLAIAASFFCSLWEAVLLSITPSYAQIQLQEGTTIGARLKAFKENVDRPLAAILTLNTIAHTVGAIGVGNQAARIWADTNPLITGVIVPVLMTLGILILSEIIPKTIGANAWKELAPFTVVSVTIIIYLLWPLVWLSQGITRLLKREKEKSVFSRSDFLAMTEIGAAQGVFAEQESEIIGNLLRFDSVQAQDVMTPRVAVVAAPETMTIAAFVEDHERDLYLSRIPLYEGGRRDHVTGYALKDEMLAAMVRGEGDATLESLRRDILIVEEAIPTTKLFRQFLAKREHIALVVDEFGGMAGIVTMEDVIETLLGTEIVDEMDDAHDLREWARESWRRRAKKLGLVKGDDDPAPEES